MGAAAHGSERMQITLQSFCRARCKSCSRSTLQITLQSILHITL